MKVYIGEVGDFDFEFTVGVFGNEKDAIDECERLINDEDNDWHWKVVIEYEVIGEVK